MKRKLGNFLRRMADRVDYVGAPRCTGWSFTFERGMGIVFNEESTGCPLWYLSPEDYDRAHNESVSAVSL